MVYEGRGYTYYMTYQFVFCVDNNINISDYADELREIFGQIADENDFVITNLQIQTDYVLISIEAKPQLFIPDTVKKLKGISGRKIGKHLWVDRTYFVCTGKMNDESIIYQYVADHKGV